MQIWQLNINHVNSMKFSEYCFNTIYKVKQLLSWNRSSVVVQKQQILLPAGLTSALKFFWGLLSTI